MLYGISYKSSTVKTSYFMFGFNDILPFTAQQGVSQYRFCLSVVNSHDNNTDVLDAPVIELRFIYSERKRQRIFFFYLCRCSILTVNWILYEAMWKRCRFRYRTNISEPLNNAL